MALLPVTAITPQGTFLITGREFAQAALIPTAGTPLGLLFTTLSGPGIVALATAVATTTATQATVGAKSIVVASAASIVLGQLVVAAGIASGSIVTSINGNTIGISLPTTAALSGTATNFLAPIQDASQGAAVTAAQPLALVIGSNTFVVYISASGGYGGGYGGGFGSAGSPAQMNVVAYT